MCLLLPGDARGSRNAGDEGCFGLSIHLSTPNSFLFCPGLTEGRVNMWYSRRREVKWRNRSWRGGGGKKKGGGGGEGVGWRRGGGEGEEEKMRPRRRGEGREEDTEKRRKRRGGDGEEEEEQQRRKKRKRTRKANPAHPSCTALCCTFTLVTGLAVGSPIPSAFLGLAGF
ncbi:motor neuron and pancreas homeobox protein 1-like isoform X3 [Pongo abelii]